MEFAKLSARGEMLVIICLLLNYTHTQKKNVRNILELLF